MKRSSFEVKNLKRNSLKLSYNSEIMDLRILNFEQTRKDLKASFQRDLLAIHTIRTLDLLEAIQEKLLAQLRERFSIYAPLAARSLEEAGFIEAIHHPKEEALSVALRNEDFTVLESYTVLLKELKKEYDHQFAYLNGLLTVLCPRFTALATPLLAGRLLERAGSLQHLACLPSSTIQVLGAEKSLFRHLKTGSKPPRFGVLFQHPSIANATESEKGKTARKLANKLSIAVKQDYFGEKQ